MIVKINKLKYTPSQVIVLEANAGLKVRDIKKSDMVGKLKESIIQGLIILGQGKDITSQQINVLTDCLLYELKTNKPNITLEEVNLAIEMGCKNKLVEITTLTMPVMSVVNILKFINFYLENVRKEVLSEKRKIEEQEENKISEIEREAKIKAFEQEIGAALLMTPEQIDSLPTGLKAAYYRHLESRGDSKITDAQKWAIWRECEKKVPQVQKSELGAFGDILHENKKREAKIKELCQSMAFEHLVK